MDMIAKEIFKNYDEELLKSLEFEIRINNGGVAIFKDFNEAERYMKTIVHNSYRWFFICDRTVVFDFCADLKEVE